MHLNHVCEHEGYKHIEFKSNTWHNPNWLLAFVDLFKVCTRPYLNLQMIILKAEILCMKTELQRGFDLGIMMNKHVHKYV